MKKNALRRAALWLSLCLLISALTACGGKPETPPTPTVTTLPTTEIPPADDPVHRDTLVVGYDAFSGKFSPFFSKTKYDGDVVRVTSVTLLGTDRDGNVVQKGVTGETVAYNGIDYTYYGIADCAVTQNEDGTVTYDFALREDIEFSDGQPLTADDVIFSMYVLADPTYDGSSTFHALPILGMAEYRSGVTAAVAEKYGALADAIWQAGPEATAFKDFTEEQYTAYWGDVLNAAGEAFVGAIVDYCMDNHRDYLALCGGNDVALAMYSWSYGEPTTEKDENGNDVFVSFTDNAGNTYDMVNTTPTKADFWQLLRTAYGNDFSETTGLDRERAGTVIHPIRDYLKTAFITMEGVKDTASGGAVDHIVGIEKTGEYGVRLTMSAYDQSSLHQLNITVAPLHYYGADDAYDYEQHRFGFTKGDLSGVRAKTNAPLGAGPYVFETYENGAITFHANEQYYKGCPKTPYLLFREIAAADRLSGVIDGTLDVTAPTYNSEAADTLAANSALVSAFTTDNLGYGYIGINADRVKVGDDKGSDESKNLRRAFATLFAVYRESSVRACYGDSASIIQYPISNTSWAAPHADEEGYSLAYATDLNGNALYTAEMTEGAKYEAALSAATEFLKAAGYTWDETLASFTAAPVGAKLTYTFILPTDGATVLPHQAVAENVKAALALIGITLDIVAPTDADQMWDALEAGTAEMWSAAWSADPDPDMYAHYHSANVVGMGGTNTNYYGIADGTLDATILEARQEADQTARKALYKTCLDTVLDWAVEIPSYQRQNAVVFSTERVNLSTVTAAITPYWDWLNDIELLEMNPIE